MTTSPTPVPSPVPTAPAVRWEVTYVSSYSGSLDTEKMADLLNDGWNFMGIQAGAGSPYAYFKRAVPVKP